MTTKHGHMGIIKAALIEDIRGGMVQPDSLEYDGVPFLSKSEAIKALQHDTRTIISTCPSPNPDGSCPSHEEPN